MCGICGILTPTAEGARRAAARMAASLGHRGPDGDGLQLQALSPARHLALGHRRLAILDLTDAGRQPMEDPATGNTLVFNGEIYNTPALRERLRSEGAVFASRSDTEVILKGYARRGLRILDELEGMFAFALYDAGRRRLVLARDPLGIKPLYYAWTARGDFLFASELRALFRSGLLPAEVDRAALAGCLAYGAVPSPLTMLEGARLLKAGEWMEVDALHPRAAVADYGRYWTFPEPGSFRGSREEGVRELAARLERAMDGHLLADVPVGLFLSAGVDSAALASLCTRLGRPVESWTYTMEDGSETDEGPEAEATARRFGLPHERIRLAPAELRGHLHAFLRALDQPTVDGFNTWLMARACRMRGRKVALSGLGGDELFGGYLGVRRLPMIQRLNRGLRALPACARAALVRRAGRWLPEGQREKLEDLLTVDWTFPELAVMRRRLFGRAAMGRLGFEETDWLLNRAALPLEADYVQGCDPADPVSTADVLDTRFYMRNMLLRDSDVFGMAHGVEIRVPLLDRRVAELAFAFPGAWRKPAGGVNKPLLAEAAAVPAGPGRRRKTGFRLPYEAWLRNEWREPRDALLHSLGERGVVDPAAVRTLCRAFDAPGGEPEWARVWMLVALEGWWASFFAPGEDAP